jgi:hypothetical protein
VTNNPNLKTVEETMGLFVPKYNALFSLFLGNSQKYVEEVGKLTLKRIEAVGDLEGELISPKTTEMKQVGVGSSSKVFSKYFIGNQYRNSSLQSQEGTDGVINQILDRLTIQFDNLFLTGGGTADNNVINNGLYWSGDANHTTNSSDEIALSGQLNNLHENIMVQAAIADALPGRKLLLLYGTTSEKARKLHTEVAVPFKAPLRESLGPDYSIGDMPSAITPSGSSGYMIINLDQIKLHYLLFPQLHRNGVNEEENYYYWNFMIASCMLEVLALNAIIKQPLTYATS